MCNQVLGRARQSLEQLGITTHMGLPELVVGHPHDVLHRLDEPVLVIPLHRDGADCVIEFAMDRSVGPEIHASTPGAETSPADSIELFDTTAAP